MLPFDVDMSRPVAEHLARRLQLTLTRVDDWDSEMGFRIVGNTGALRLFRRTTDNEDTARHPWYEFYGTAVESSDREPIRQLYGECLEAVEAVRGRVDDFRVIDPDHSVELLNDSGSRRGETS
jgi:hypothetical protein